MAKVKEGVEVKPFVRGDDDRTPRGFCIYPRVDGIRGHGDKAFCGRPYTGPTRPAVPTGTFRPFCKDCLRAMGS